MLSVGAQRLASADVPHARGAILRGRDDQAAVAGYGKRHDGRTRKGADEEGRAGSVGYGLGGQLFPHAAKRCHG